MIEAELPDGTILEFPEGTSPEVMKAAVQRMGKPTQPSFGQQFKKELLTSLPGGFARGLKDVVDTGAWVLAKGADLVTGNKGYADQVDAQNKAGKAEFEQAQKDVGAGGSDIARIGGNITATFPVGGVLARGASMIPGVAKTAPSLIEALRTGGMSAAGRTGMASIPVRALAGGTVGGTSAAMVNPEDAGMGAAFGFGLPVVGQSIASASQFVSPERLMQSALKPTLAQQKSGEAKSAVDTLLKYGINATKGGVEKLKGMAQGVDDEISGLIKGSDKTISRNKVLESLNDVRLKFANQVSPTSDISAIQKIGDDFAQHPLLPDGDIPIELAQKLKQGTYKVLDKKYGQIGTAETEAQKGLARGLKEQIAEAVPGVAGLNAKQSELIKALKVTNRRAMMDDNANMIGIAGLSPRPSQLLMMLADRSALAKSLAARGANALRPEDSALLEALRSGVYKAAPLMPGQTGQSQ